MTSIAESLRRAEAILADGGVAEPRREAISLLAAATKKDTTFIYAHPEFVLSIEDTDAFNSFLQRRWNREPLQYIRGIQEFYGLDFEVTPDVLIPRPETEMVVEKAIEILGEGGERSFCEVGVGSGCIAISILHHLPNAFATGLEISSTALEVAYRNVERHHVGRRLKLVQSDVFDVLRHEKFDLIVSNPPYVPMVEFEGLQTEVRDYEPRMALTDGSDGLSIIRRIVNGAPPFLRPRGSLLMEIGFNQSERVASLFDRAVWQTPELFPDLQGIPRLVRARLI